jgi:hypothetical protein
MDWDWLDTVGEYVSKPFEWMEANPNVTKFIGGAAAAGLSHMASQDQRKHDERMYDRRKKDSQISPSSGTGDYGGHIGQLSGGTGLLTSGYMTKK